MFGRMRSPLFAALLALTACIGPDIEQVRRNDVTQAGDLLRRNVAAIQRRDLEAYLALYLDSPELVIAGADSLRRGYLLFAAARRASGDWPDTMVAGEPTLVWVGPGVVWAAFEFTSVFGSDTTSGWSERLLVKTAGGWKIFVTGTMER
jgi:hypothetical protein